MIHRSPLPDVDIPDESLTTYALYRAAELGDKPALIDGPTGRVLTYAALEQAVRSLAGGLVARGFAKGDVLALMAPNLPEYAVVFHGVAFAGGVITTINPTYTDREVHHQLLDSGATLLVTVPPFLETALRPREGTRVDRRVRPRGAARSGPARGRAAVPGAARRAAGGAGAGCPGRRRSRCRTPPGTTGVSKGVMLTHRNLVANIAPGAGARRDAGGREDHRRAAVLPHLRHAGAHEHRPAGGCDDRSRCRVSTWNSSCACTRSTASPGRSWRRRSFSPWPSTRSSTSSTSPRSNRSSPVRHRCRRNSREEAGKRLDAEVVQGYGMTEMSPVSHLTPPGYYKPGSVGVTAPNTEIRVVDPASGEDLGIDEDGELWVRGPQVMKGYHNNPEATAITLDEDGWLRTGDIAHIDDDGHVYVVDRLKELIKYKGFQVAPAELESLLLTHPAVADAAVIGLPDEEAGEIPVGYVVLKPGAEASAEDIQAFVAEQVAHVQAAAPGGAHGRHPQVGVREDPAPGTQGPGPEPGLRRGEHGNGGGTEGPAAVSVPITAGVSAPSRRPR